MLYAFFFLVTWGGVMVYWESIVYKGALNKDINIHAKPLLWD